MKDKKEFSPNEIYNANGAIQSVRVNYLRILRIVLIYLFAVLLLELLLPARSGFQLGGKRLLWNILFYGLIFLTSGAIIANVEPESIGKKENLTAGGKQLPYLSVQKLHFMLKSASLLGVAGLFALVFDLVVFKGVDYTKGIRHARYQWLTASSPHMFSTILSILGNGLVLLSFTALLLLLLHWEDVRKTTRWLTLLFSATGCMGFAAIHASRSTILIMLVLVASVLIIRKCTGKSWLPRVKNKVDKRLYALIICGVLLVLYITYSSFVMSLATTTQEYFSIAAGIFNGTLDSNYFLFLKDVLPENSILYIFFYALLYLLHSQWYMEAALLMAYRPGSVALAVFELYLSNLGILASPPEPYYYAGLFISMPGALYYDFGYFGILFGAIAVGLLLGMAIVKLSKPTAGGGFVVALVLFTVGEILLSPIISAHGISYFLLVLVDIILFELFTRIFYKKSSWLYLDRSGTRRDGRF